MMVWFYRNPTGSAVGSLYATFWFAVALRDSAFNREAE